MAQGDRAGTRGAPRAHVSQAAHRAKSLSTICVDKVVHSLRKSDLSGLRERLFCRCSLIELDFFRL